MKKRDDYRVRRKLEPTRIAAVVAAVAILVLGNRLAVRGVELFSSQQDATTPCIVRVESVGEPQEQSYGSGEDTVTTSVQLRFSGTVIYGENEGDNITGVQNIQLSALGSIPQVQVRDRVFVTDSGDGATYTMTEFYRSDRMIAVAAVFGVLLIVFGGLKGVSALISLALSVMSVFAFLVPAILSGFNIYLCVAAVCAYNIAVTPLLVGGFSKKSLASILGCVGGVGIAALTTRLLCSLWTVSGITDEDMIFVMMIDTGTPIDLNAIIFAMVLIGALGACIDVSMSIASPVFETAGDENFGALLRFGVNIGRDILGAQTSTLVLAYIGSSLSTVLLLMFYQNSLLELFNLEMVVAEVMETLVGAFAILFTIPATALVAALIRAPAAHRLVLDKSLQK